MQPKIPNLRFPRYTGDWNPASLSKFIISLDSGVSVNSSDQPAKQNSLGILKTSCVSGGKFLPDENKIILENDIERARLNPKKGAILISRMNTPELVGELGYIDQDFMNLFIPDRLWMTNTTSDIDTQWLTYLLVTPRMRYMISSIATGTSGSMKNISKPNFLGLNLNYPSLPEQQKIASFLSEVDKKIQLLTRKKELLVQYKKGVMQKLFTQEIRFKDNNGKDFPDWEELRAKEVFKNHTNKDHNGDLPILAATQDKGVVPRDSIGIEIQSSEASIKSYKVVEQGDFVISLRSFQGGIEYSSYLGICSPAYTILKPSKDLNKEFFRYYFKKEDFISRISKTVIGIRDGKQISYDAFSGLKLPFPCTAEQQKIATFLKALDLKILKVEEQITGVTKFKKGLLQQMFV
ncbi:restriction endonuclease subunit S [Marinoscillum sp.]|uniref:restriction endonuclease subunit S n=1 Tax=Marinoscillum sp. TaxID=2024838 RepID=UPI003BA9EE57